MELTSLDLSILIEELEVLEEGFVQQVYQRDNELSLEIYVPGDEKKRLIIGPSYAFLSKYKRDNPKRPPGFCMELRKHLGKIDSVKQRGFDRILEIESGDRKLIAELFGKGNAFLLEGERITGAIRQEEYADRSVVVGEKYEAPEPTNDPRPDRNYFEIMKSGELVRRAASDLSLGGTYAEEVCSIAGIRKNRKIEELDQEERETVQDAVDELLESAENPSPVLYTDGMPVRAAPFELENYREYEKETFETFSRALDEYYYRIQRKEREREKQEAFREKKQGLERQREQQERKIEGLEKSSQENRRKAELIYENYQLLENIKKSIEEGIEKHGWDKTAEKVRNSDGEQAGRINAFNQQEGFVSVTVDDMNIKIEPGENLEATASNYYDRAKESESKIESAREALKRTEEELGELEKESIEVGYKMKDQSSKRSKKWFEKYRWFYSSEGFLVCVGRDAQTNEMLVKKHMDEKDLYFHADFEGAPSVVVKDGQEAGEETLEEAAKAAVTFSRNWKAGITSGTAYYVKPGQVTKEPESGEYLKKGAFVIRGEREYMRNVSVEAAIGPYQMEEAYLPICGPFRAVEENCREKIFLKPGKQKKSEVAKKIRSKFDNKDYDLDLDYIIRCLPPGKSEIKDRGERR